jgi:hypothetical protein
MVSGDRAELINDHLNSLDMAQSVLAAIHSHLIYGKQYRAKPAFCFRHGLRPTLGASDVSTLLC